MNTHTHTHTHTHTFTSTCSCACHCRLSSYTYSTCAYLSVQDWAQGWMYNCMIDQHQDINIIHCTFTWWSKTLDKVFDQTFYVQRKGWTRGGVTNLWNRLYFQFCVWPDLCPETGLSLGVRREISETGCTSSFVSDLTCYVQGRGQTRGGVRNLWNRPYFQFHVWLKLLLFYHALEISCQ